MAIEHLGNAVFLDKSAFMAYMNTENPHYPKARSFMIELDDLDRIFVTSNSIIFAVHQWLRDDFGYVQAEFFLNVIDKAVQREKLVVVPGSSDVENQSRELLMKLSDFHITLEEALIAIVMSMYRIRRILTFNPAFSFLSKMNGDIKVIPSLNA